MVATQVPPYAVGGARRLAPDLRVNRFWFVSSMVGRSDYFIGVSRMWLSAWLFVSLTPTQRQADVFPIDRSPYFDSLVRRPTMGRILSVEPHGPLG
jgi:hypothetical protein